MQFQIIDPTQVFAASLKSIPDAALDVMFAMYSTKATGGQAESIDRRDVIQAELKWRMASL